MSRLEEQLPLVERMRPFGTTIFAEMSALALTTDSINLGQGFPDTDGPPEVLQAAVDAIGSGRHNQYPPGPGTPELREAIAAHQKRFYGLDYDPSTEILVTAGATEAIAAALIALLEPGDEAIVFEPYYDSYPAGIAMAAAGRRVVTLRRDGQDWVFDPDDLRRAVTTRTRLILLNTPHNPTGKVFTTAELDQIAEIARAHDLVVISDEVYEHLVFDRAHVPIATRPGMRERTLTVSSAGKTFSVTGWKIGWVCAPARFVTAVRTVKQFLTFVSGGPFQPAVALGLGLPDAYFDATARALRDQRDLLCDGLERLGWDVVRPQATYFATARVDLDAMSFCRELPRRHRVVAIPTSVFYDGAAGDHLVRFAFCKRPAVLHRRAGETRNPGRGRSAMQVAVIQHDIVWQDGAATTSRLEPLVAQAAAAGARLVVLTEMFATGFSMRAELIAEPPGGPIEAWLIAQARRHGIHLLGSVAQADNPSAEGGSGRAVNVAILAGPDGRTARYEKMHPFTFAGEHEQYRAGDKPLTVDIEGVRTSIFICYDLRFADDFWVLAHDTDCYVVVANWPEPRREHWRALLRARAIENQAYVVAANRVGAAGAAVGDGATASGRRLNHVGDSAIIDPLGRTLAEAAHVETIITADVDAEQVAEVRARFPFLRDRTTDRTTGQPADQPAAPPTDPPADPPADRQDAQPWHR